MKKLLQGLSDVIVNLAELVVGVLLLVNPESVTSSIVVAVGVVLICLGMISILKYFRTAPADAAKQKMLAKGMIMALVGGFCVIRFGWIVNTFTVLTALYGAVLILGLIKLEEMVDILRLKHIRWQLAAISAAIAIIGGIVIICNPFGTAKVMWTVIGICLISEAACDIIHIFFGDKEKKEKPAKEDQEEQEEEEA